MLLELAVTGGRIAGSEEGGVAVFRGIPYAAAPFGDLRFQAPQPVTPWSGVRPAVDFGPTAPHPPYPTPLDQLLPEPTIPGEDCLNLNVWTPDTSATGLPVLVWIHGGAFVNGSGAVPQYSGAAFARDGVVTVTINYRLGMEGFLQVDDGGTSNLGLRDQLAALTWVQESIAAFGGDPSRVTVAGESAGAMSIGALLSTKAAQGLFRAAILQSGAGHHALPASTAARVTGFVAERLGIAATREALAAVPAADLLAAQVAVGAEAQMLPDPAKWGEVAVNLMAFEPVIDGDLLPDLPIRTITTGVGVDVPVLIGTNRDEHRLFLVPNGIIDFIDDNLLGMAAGLYGLPATSVEVYRSPGATPGEVLADMSGDWFFRLPAIRLAEARTGAATYMYEFRWPSAAYDGKLGSCHALEIGFVFDTFGDTGDLLVGGTPPRELIEEMHAVWVAFIVESDPGWAPYSAADRVVRVFGDAALSVPTETDPRAKQREVWEGIR